MPGARLEPAPGRPECRAAVPAVPPGRCPRDPVLLELRTPFPPSGPHVRAGQFLEPAGASLPRLSLGGPLLEAGKPDELQERVDRRHQRDRRDHAQPGSGSTRAPTAVRTHALTCARTRRSPAISSQTSTSTRSRSRDSSFPSIRRSASPAGFLHGYAATASSRRRIATSAGRFAPSAPTRRPSSSWYRARKPSSPPSSSTTAVVVG
jgi:hypothetical protein